MWKLQCRLFPLIVFAVAAALTGDLPAQTPVDITPDVVYGHKDGLAMTMDVIRPRENANGATVVFMVSGGWVSQWRPTEEMVPYFEPLLAEGYTVIAVRHGSSPRYGIADAVSDVRRAIRAIRYRADELQVDSERLAVMGMSAGGHLALMLATTGDDGDPDAEDPVLRESSRVATVVAVVPPSDLRIMTWDSEESLPAYRNFPALDISQADAAEHSPLLHVSDDDAGALVISASRDQLVPPKHGEWMVEALEEHGVACRLVLLDAGHGLGDKFPDAFEASLEWLSEQMGVER